MAVDIPTPLHAVFHALSHRLAVVFPPEHFAHDMVPAQLSKPAYDAIAQRAPFVGLGWDAVPPHPRNGRLFVADQTWTLFLVTKNVAGVRQRFVGDRFGIGLFHMVTAAIATLSGHTIANVGTIEVASCANMVSREWDMGDAAMATLTLHIPHAWSPAPVLDDLEPSGMLKTLGIDWDAGPDAQQEVDPLGVAA